MFACYALFLILRNFSVFVNSVPQGLKKYLQDKGFLLKDIQIKENLDNYLKSLKKQDLEWSYEQIEYYDHEYGLQLAFDGTLHEMKEEMK